MAQTTFTYKVRDRQGQMIGGTLEADSQTAVAARLRQMGYAPISIEAAKSVGLKMEFKLPGGGRVKPKDLAVFSRQFATMINSGLSLLRALTILADQTDNKRLAQVVGAIRSEVEKGTALSTAMAQHPKVFNRLFVAMIRSGEVGGFLDQVLLRLAETLERDVTLRGKIKSAMTYPVVVFAMVLLIVSAMLVFIVPMFKNLYASLGGQLSASSGSASASAAGSPPRRAATAWTPSSCTPPSSARCSTRAPCRASRGPSPPCSTPACRSCRRLRS